MGSGADLEAMLTLGAGGGGVGQRDPFVAGDDGIVVEPAWVDDDAGVTAGEVEDVVAHRLGGDVDGLARHDRTGAGEGARVVGRAVGGGVGDVDVEGGHAGAGSGGLPVRRGDAVGQLGRASGEVGGGV